ncbi:hypothetical protein PRIPAC_78644 [Pristionchus pacificus]|uniref:Uncharacterized protein n=1 Tax=Pristionchus pacificus TaxID=54126 RepID=A0A2A6CPP8_PRIPA|nr:hypothetical protein PRIPAC_78644 [Pristionchus pacificus]|eukprot:PDM80164.1 hypothetical protein PRIPAC_32743 [Pristionchus pacificus]
MARKSTKKGVQKRLFSSPSSSSTTIGRDAANDENLPPPEGEEEREEGQQQEVERMEEDGVFLAPSPTTPVPRRKTNGSSERKKGRRKNGQHRGDGDTTPKNSRRPVASPATPAMTTRALLWPASKKFVTERMADLKRRYMRLVQETGTLNLRIDKMFPDLVKPSDRIDPFERVGAPRTFVWMSNRGRAEMEKEKRRIEEEVRMGRTSKAAREREAHQKRADMYGNLKAKIRETWEELAKEAEIAIQNEQKALAAEAVEAAAAAAAAE